METLEKLFLTGISNVRCIRYGKNISDGRLLDREILHRAPAGSGNHLKMAVKDGRESF